MGRWAVVGVQSLVPWPKADTELSFRGSTLILRPETPDWAASVAFEHPGSMRTEDAFKLIRNFLSSVSWANHAPIREVGALSGSGPFLVGKGPRTGTVVTDRFRQDYIPEPPDERSRLALALYREALSLESIPYKYLTFFKIINVLYPTGAQQRAWLTAHLPLVRNSKALERIRELTLQVTDPAAYMYESGRCAIAHAYNQPLIDPDDMEDNRRLSMDLPVLEELAEYLIETELGVKSSHTVWREHLYQLEGFRDLLGEDLIARLKRREPITTAEIPALPGLTICVRDKPTLPSFTDLSASVIGVDDGTIWLACDTRDGSLKVVLGLAVADEYLVFDPEQHVAVRGERNLNALKARRDHMTLFADLLRNGQLAIVDAASGKQLGRTDAYVGMNIDVSRTLRSLDETMSALDREIAQLSGQTT